MTAAITPASTTLLSHAITTAGGVTHIDMGFSAAIARGVGTIFVTDGALQTVIDRATGLPALRVVGATVTRTIDLGSVSINGSHASFDAAGLAPGGHYSIYMVAGTFSSGGRPVAGYTAPTQLAFDVPAAPEPQPQPSLEAGFSFDHTTLKTGQDIEITLTLSRAVTDLPAPAFSADNASVDRVIRTADPQVWKVVLTRSEGVADAENVLRLDLAQVEITPGVHGSGSLVSPAYAVDTLVGAWVTAAASSRDTGESDSDGIIDHDTPVLSGQLAGGLNAGERIEILINGAPVDPAGISVDGSTLGWSYEPGQGAGAPVFNEGANTVVVRVVDAQGHSSADYSTTIVVDTLIPDAPAAPVLDPTSDSGTAGDDITNHSTPTLHGLAEAGAWISIHDGAALLGEARAGASGSWEITLPALLDGLHELAIVQTDVAGNASAATAFGLRIDTTVAALATPSLAVDSGTPGDRITNDSTLQGAGAEAGARIEILKGGAVVGSGSADADGNWNAIFTTQLLDGAHSVTVRQVDLAGNVGAASPAFDFTLDSSGTVSTLSAPVLAAASDTGLLDNDGITRDTTPSFSGSGALANATVLVFAGAREIGRTTANAAGNWSLTVAEPKKLAVDGSYSITARQIDGAGKTSAASSALEIQIDTTRPVMIDFNNDRTAKTFELQFNEQVVFDRHGDFKLMQGLLERRVFKGDDPSNWHIATQDGKSTLTLDIGMNGTYKLHMHGPEVIQDLAGNAAIITGSPIWDIINGLLP